MRVFEDMQRQTVCCHEGEPVSVGMRLVDELGLVVVHSDSDFVTGVLTVREFRSVQRNVCGAQRRLRDVMARNLFITCVGSELTSEVRARMRRARVSHAVVVDGKGSCVGVLIDEVSAA